MDKNTVTGLVLIGVILSAFAIFNQPSEEELKANEAKHKRELAKEEAKKNARTVKAEDVQEEIASNDESLDSSSTQTAVDEKKKAEFIKIENEKLIVELSTEGGMVSAVYLKEFETYHEFAKNDSTHKPLRLFLRGDATNSLLFQNGGKNINTKDLFFDVKSKSANSITLSSKVASGKKVEFTYSLPEDMYDMRYNVELIGLKDAVASGVALDWKTSFRKTERLFSEQRRVSTVCYKYDNEGFDYLSEMGDDEEPAEDDVEWVAYKQSYFSSILQPDVPFSKKGTELTVYNYKETEKKINTHLKDMNSVLALDMPISNNSSMEMNWFFGPNDFEVLAANGEGYDDILNFGWGLFRWINIYAVQPLFNFLMGTGLSTGIAILLLTLVLKLVLTPIQWKMYVSSAKMRIMKPEIDELNAKFPNKEDSMKKQMEMMSLYKASGASPLSGCVPMLIQMPILLAVFRFFPSAFELRQKGFLWAEDLSSYDSIWDFGIYIWPYGDHVSLFTLLMAGTTLIYTHINSGNMQQPQQPGMPNMKVIMYIFPFMMIFFFNNYSSGLSYYYFVSTLISIILMVLIKNYFVDEDKLTAKMAARKVAAADNGGKKKKSKFQERMENMQKMQQEKMKNAKK
jgi:YidC/Oxa1 family membrane protein insertase